MIPPGIVRRSSPSSARQFRRWATSTEVAAAGDQPGRTDRTAQRGLSILECTAALAVAGLAILSTTRATTTAAAVVQRGRLVADTTGVARGLLEHELGAPCAASFSCPPHYRCSIARTRIGATLDRVSASVTRIDSAASEELRTLAPPASCGS